MVDDGGEREQYSKTLIKKFHGVVYQVKIFFIKSQFS